MHLVLRPSKSFLYQSLKKELPRANGLFGLDIGSADFKNRAMFHTENYYGLDIDLLPLRNGLQKYPAATKTFGILADMTKLDDLPSGSVDLVVCTNTLQSHLLDFNKRKIALEHLCRLPRPGGQLVIELAIDKYFAESLKIINEYFYQVKIKYYGNWLSRKYEDFIENKLKINPRFATNSRILLLLSLLISKFEYLTVCFKKGNSHALIHCGHKKSLDLSLINQI